MRVLEPVELEVDPELPAGAADEATDGEALEAIIEMVSVAEEQSATIAS
jgi:hypothetical protein